jgi:hypothetical protein
VWGLKGGEGLERREEGKRNRMKRGRLRRRGGGRRIMREEGQGGKAYGQERKEGRGEAREARGRVR